MRFALFAPVSLFLLSSAVVASDAPVPVIGTKVVMVPPPGFVQGERFNGFMKQELGASIMVNELPGPYAQISATMTADSLASRGMTLVGREELTFGDQPGIVLEVKQSQQGVEFQKWLALFGNDANTVMVMATYPAENAETLRKPMRSSVLSARWSADAKPPAPFEGLGYRLKENATLKVSQRIGNVLSLTEGGKPLAGPGAPLMVAGSAVSDVKIDDLAGFAKARLGQTAMVKDLRELKGRQTKVAGLTAYELEGRGTHTTSNEPLALYQLLIVEGGAYHLVQGMVREPDAKKFLPQFREVARSFTLAKPAK